MGSCVRVSAGSPQSSHPAAEVSSAWTPQIGDLVGIKKLSLQGIVIKTETYDYTHEVSGCKVGIAQVLVEEQLLVYAWSDLYHVETDDLNE